MNKGGQVSTSTQVAILRRLLDGEGKGEVGRWFREVRKVCDSTSCLRTFFLMFIWFDFGVQGKIRLVVDVESADIMATLLRLKAEVESKVFNETKLHQKLKLTFSGATEAHILARELSHAKVGVLVHPRPYPYFWESRRMYVLQSHVICKP
jgi:hypothetical protein